MPITIKNSAGGGVTLDSTTSSNETLNLPSGGGTLAPSASPVFTGTTTANKLNVTGVVDNTISGTLVVKGSLSANQTSGLALFQQSSTASTIKAFGPDATTTGILNTYVAASDGSPDSLITSVTANGLTFNGDTAAANALDDYETGSWTPSVTGISGGTVTSYHNRAGRYIKIGTQVTLWFYFHTATVSGMSGTAKITGLPFSFTSDMANNAGFGTVSAYYLNQSSLRDITLVRAGVGAMGLLGSLSTNGITGNAGWQNLQSSAFTATALQGVFTYRSS